MTKLILFLACIIIVNVTSIQAAILHGVVKNKINNEPVAYATINLPENSQTIMTNEDGSFSLYVDKQEFDLTCSHIAYFTFRSHINILSDTTKLEILLNSSLIELPAIKVYERNYDAAQIIIREAIRHKDEILAKLKSYQFDAYTKMTVWDASKPDSLKPMFLTETELTAYWKYPSEYKEIITARKQSANLEAENNLVTIGEVLNFNNNRIDFGINSIVTPTAQDALEYYNYYLLDTLYYDLLPVYLLEIEPKSKTTPLFIGTIQINAQSYEIMGVDLTFNEGLDNPYLKEFSYTQEYQLFENEFWMPTVIKFKGVMDIPFPLIPIISFSYTAGLQRYSFEKEYGDTIFNDYVLEVDNNADDYDSTQWLSNRFIPLTITEENAYTHIDSVKRNKPLYKKLIPIIPGIMIAVTSMQDYFHFNRVEGAYLGGKFELTSPNSKFETFTKLGYAFDANLWQHDNRLKYFLSKKHKLSIQAGYHDNIQTWRTINAPTNGNATALSILAKKDPYDYYREKGLAVTVSIAPVKQTILAMSYNNFRQSQMDNNSSFSFFNKDSTHRENLPITNGKLNSLKLSFTYDSNKMIRVKGKEQSIFSYPYTALRIGTEISDRSNLQSDFDFKKIFAQLYTTRQVFGLGITSFGVFATTKLSGQLPPQRYTVMDFGGSLLDEKMIFKTLNSNNFTATEILSVYTSHDFGTRLFKKSQFPLIKNIPYSFSIHGGIFWAEFSEDNDIIYKEFTRQTENPYSEIGFAIGRLPLLLKVSLTWQLSKYDTEKFFLGIGFDF